MPAETTGTPVTPLPGGTINIGSGWASTTIPSSFVGGLVGGLIDPLRGGRPRPTTTGPATTPEEEIIDIKTTTRTNPDGSTTRTETTKYPDGSTTIMATYPDGSRVEKDLDGKVTFHDAPKKVGAAPSTTGAATTPGTTEQPQEQPTQPPGSPKQEKPVLNIKLVTLGGPLADPVIHLDPGPATTPEKFVQPPMIDKPQLITGTPPLIPPEKIETTTRKDPDGSTITTDKHSDGRTVTTTRFPNDWTVEVTKHTDGTSTETRTNPKGETRTIRRFPDGSTSTVDERLDGSTTKIMRYPDGTTETWYPDGTYVVRDPEGRMTRHEPAPKEVGAAPKAPTDVSVPVDNREQTNVGILPGQDPQEAAKALGGTILAAGPQGAIISVVGDPKTIEKIVQEIGLKTIFVEKNFCTIMTPLTPFRGHDHKAHEHSGRGPHEHDAPDPSLDWGVTPPEIVVRLE